MFTHPKTLNKQTLNFRFNKEKQKGEGANFGKCKEFSYFWNINFDFIVKDYMIHMPRYMWPYFLSREGTSLKTLIGNCHKKKTLWVVVVLHVA